MVGRSARSGGSNAAFPALESSIVPPIVAQAKNDESQVSSPQRPISSRLATSWATRGQRLGEVAGEMIDEPKHPEGRPRTRGAAGAAPEQAIVEAAFAQAMSAQHTIALQTDDHRPKPL